MKENWVKYKCLYKKAKNILVVSKTELMKYNKLYEKLKTKGDEKEVYRLAKIREKTV